MSRLILPVIAFALVSCAIPVVGPNSASISAEDVRQIEQLVASRDDLPKAILRIHATRPSCVYVETGRPVIRGLEKSFVACKQNGKWRIREKSVEGWRTIVTE